MAGVWIECSTLGYRESGEPSTWFQNVREIGYNRLVSGLTHYWAWNGLVPEAEGRSCMRVHFSAPE